MEIPSREVVTKRNGWRISLLIFLIIAFIIFVMLFIFMGDILFGRGKLTGDVVANLNEATMKLVCKQQSYQDTEYYNEQVPYEDIEYYVQTEGGSNCDYVTGCTCIHKSWLGLGPCDSCECRKSRTVTKYRMEQKSRTVTKLIDVCIKLKLWQSPNYNENWLEYSEIYDKNGNPIIRPNIPIA